MAHRLNRFPRWQQPQDAARPNPDFPWSFLWTAVDPGANLLNNQRATLRGTQQVGPVGIWTDFHSATAVQAYNVVLPTTQFTAVIVWHPDRPSTSTRSVLRTTGGGFRIEPSSTAGGVTVNVTHTGVAGGAGISTSVSGHDPRPWTMVVTADGVNSKLWIKSPDGLVQYHSQAAGIGAGTGTLDLSTSSGSMGISLAAMSNRCATDAHAVALVNNPWQMFEDEVLYVPMAAPAGGNLTLPVDASALTLTAQPLPLSQSVNVAPSQLALTGQIVAFPRSLNVASAPLALTGQTIGVPIFMSVAAGALGLAGQDVTLANSGDTGLTVPVDAGALTLSGSAVGLSQSIAVGTASLAFTGGVATLPRALGVTGGSLALTGSEVAFAVGGSLTVPVSAGALTLTGQPIGVTLSEAARPQRVTWSLKRRAVGFALARRTIACNLTRRTITFAAS